MAVYIQGKEKRKNSVDVYVALYMGDCMGWGGFLLKKKKKKKELELRIDLGGGSMVALGREEKGKGEFS